MTCRRAFKLIAFLLAGAIINVAVAWGCAIRSDSGGGWFMYLGQTIDGTDRSEWRVNTVVGWGATNVLSQAFIRTEDSFATMTAAEALPWWCPWLQPYDPIDQFEFFTQSADAYGMPMRSMMVVIDHVHPERARGLRPWTVDGIPEWIRGTTRRGLRPSWPVLLPLHPLWPGFAINTIFYAVILWCLFAAPLKLRRWRRVKRGLCPACAYPLGESEVCTECGIRHPPRRRVTQPA